MTDPALIERIVSHVLEQIQQGERRPSPPIAARPSADSTPTVKYPASRPSTAAAVSPTPGPAKTVAVKDAVVTAAVLERAGLADGGVLVVGTKAVLTPSAHDWLRQHRVTWRRGEATIPVTTTPALEQAARPTVRWQVLASTMTATVRSLLEQIAVSHGGWKRALSGDVHETAAATVQMIQRGETERVLVVAGAADVLACRVNRHVGIRAAVVHSAEHLRAVHPELSPNVVILNPHAKSLMDLRHIVQACDALEPPEAPTWDHE